MYRNIKLILQYDGSRYGGWLKQGNSQNTIQGKLESILEKMTGEPILVHGSGRTDAGVHALGQTANVHLDENCLKNNKNPEFLKIFDSFHGSDGLPKAVMEYLNRYLPEDIAVIGAEEVLERFHSRLSAVSKTYLYRVETAGKKNVFERKYAYGLGEKLDIGAMRQMAVVLEGTHDFRGFSSLKRTKKSTVRTLQSIEIEQNGSVVELSFTGDGFLYNMVRILTGTLLEAGLHRRTPESAEEIFKSLDREQAGFTAPAEGLFLKCVRYE